MSLQPEELEAMENVLPEKYEQSRGEKKLRSQREDFSDMVAEVVCASQNEKKRKHKMPYMRDLSSIKFCKKPSRLQVTVTRIAGK
ncbi:uncharacterized protein LOC133729698 [Rosa rugosa]|uniref:uncharacterized protein LOC133729698 n=1 Tax=Rosa rugosa TaxID=74645 RepID=UPI002B418412|nr:uncharacterized protein LOC133729698 [Rosa rugosa]